MTDHVKSILRGQFEAALCMLNKCLAMCPEEHWDGKIANDTFRQVAYHTLFWTECYLSSNEAAFALREIHERGGDERSSTIVSAGLSKEEALAYVQACRQKMLDALSSETAESLAGPSGFSRQPFSRGELYFYNCRHVQHHTGQLSAYLRRIITDSASWWVKSGWQ